MKQTMLFLFFLMLTTVTFSKASPSIGSRCNRESQPVGTLQVNCSEDELRCWGRGKLLHTDGNCYAPLQQGPCPDDKWFVLDLDAERNFLRGKCVRLECPPDRTSSGCRRRMQDHARSCPRTSSGSDEYAVHVNPMGEFRCGDFPGRVRSLQDHVTCASTVI